jgi:solute carrier family 25 phosphate transporter 23/24/25/41
MKPSTILHDLEHGLVESQNQRDARVEELWGQLDPNRTGELDVKGLQKGLKRIDHPMKNADDMIKNIMCEVDTNNDGKIQFEEFRTFVERAELQLFELFKTIDKDGNGKLDMKELQVAFKNAGLTVSTRRLADFFSDMDLDDDGYVNFGEWRDFLLFMPVREGGNHLGAILSFYNSVVSVTPEGDSLVSDDTLEGLGTDGSSRSLFYSLFGSLLRVAYPVGHEPIPKCEEPSLTAGAAADALAAVADAPRVLDEDGVGQRQTVKIVSRDVGDGIARENLTTTEASATSSISTVSPSSLSTSESTTTATSSESSASSLESSTATTPASISTTDSHKKKYTLTDFIPDPGYFLAGAIAGGVSRTATAPLDRLKVYLLVNTSHSAENAVGALKQAKPAAAVKHAARPFSAAVRDLYQSGGLRGFFAGNGLNVVKIMPETAIKFGSYEAAKRALANIEGHGDPKKINSWSKFTAGGVAGMIAQ